MDSKPQQVTLPLVTEKISILLMCPVTSFLNKVRHLDKGTSQNAEIHQIFHKEIKVQRTPYRLLTSWRVKLSTKRS